MREITPFTVEPDPGTSFHGFIAFSDGTSFQQHHFPNGGILAVIHLQAAAVSAELRLDDLCRRGKHQVVYFHWRPCLSDPKDDHILELAVASSTSTIVTHNVRDFKRTTEFGIRAITPGQLLEELKWEH